MGGFFRQTHPHLVLFSLFHADEGKIHHGDEHQHHNQFDVWEERQAAKHCGIFVVEILCGAFVDGYCYGVVRALEFVEFLFEVVHVRLRYFPGRHAVDGFWQAEIAVQQNLVVFVYQHHGNGVVALDDAKQEVDLLVGHTLAAVRRRRQLFGGICPNFHSFTLLNSQVVHQAVADI